MKRVPQVVLVSCVGLLLAADARYTSGPEPNDARSGAAPQEASAGISLAASEKAPAEISLAVPPVLSVASGFWTFSPDERFFAAGEKVWELPSGRLVGQVGASSSVVFSPHGTPLEVTWESKIVRIKEILTRETLLETPGEEPRLAVIPPRWLPPFSLIFVPTLAEKGTAELWSIGGKRLLTIQEPELCRDLLASGSRGEVGVDCLTVSQDGSHLAWLTPARKIHLWDLDHPASEPCVLAWDEAGEANGVRAFGDVLLLSFHGERVAVLEHIRETTQLTAIITICNAATAKRQCVIRLDITGASVDAGRPLFFSFSPSGEQLLTILPYSVVQNPTAREVWVWDTRTGRQLRRWPLKSRDQIRAFLASSDACSLAAAGHCRFWRLTRPGGPIRSVDVGCRETAHLAVSGEGFLMADGVADVLRETASQLPVAQLPRDVFRWPIAFSPRSRYLVTHCVGANQRYETRVWDLQHGSAGNGVTGYHVAALVGKLRSQDPIEAQRAVRRLITSGDTVLPDLAAAWPPVVPAEQIAKLIAQLDDDKFEVREAATRELEKSGLAAKEGLEKAVKESQSLEVRGRAQRVLLAIQRAPRAPDAVFQMRAIQVLAGIGSDAARDQLQRLATTSRDERVAALARLSLTRLRSGSK